MISVFVTFLIAVVIAATSTPLVRRFALAVGAVDEPSARRVNQRRIPRLGGIAIVAGFLLPLLGLFALRTTVGQAFFARPRLVAGFIVGALVVCTLGVLDDVLGIGAKRKLLVQSLAAAIAFAAGFRIEAISLPFVGAVQMQWLALPVTMLWIVGIVNALNLIDGLDGLAAGVAFLACLTNFVLGYLGNNITVCLLSATLAGTLLGFLFHNFNPATIFMGDSGSMFLGYVLALMSIWGNSGGSQKSGTAIAIVVPVLSLGLPIMDMLFAMVRRFLERRPIFAADRGHIHHRLLDLGLTHRRAVIFLYGASVVFTIVALAMHFASSVQVGLTLVGMTVTVVGVVRLIGHVEVSVRGAEASAQAAQDLASLQVAIASLAVRGHVLPVEALEQELVHFCVEAGFVAFRVSGTTPLVWSRENVDAVGPTVSESVPVNGEEGLLIQFEWPSRSGVVRNEERALLGVVAVILSRGLRRGLREQKAHLRPVSTPS